MLKESTGKPLPNASVVFHPIKDGEDAGHMEMKTGPDGKAIIEVIPTGSVVGLQVLANGFATHGSKFALKEARQSVTIRMVPPKSQVSSYGANVTGTTRGMGVREPERRAVDSTPRVLTTGDAVIKLPGVSAVGGGSISGQVTDATGLPVAGATVKITDVAGTLKPRILKATDDGRFAVVNLAAGVYSVKIEAGGYRPDLREKVELADKQSQVLDTVLGSNSGKRAKK